MSLTLRTKTETKTTTDGGFPKPSRKDGGKPCGECRVQPGETCDICGASKQVHTPEAIAAEFTRCLGTMSHSRAGWDYQLPPAQRAEENRQEKTALARVRAIWAENPDMHDALRAAFKAAGPLASMREIEQVPA